ncbi:unnamed protein product, partial [Prorocentrum cordatum]
MEVDSAEHDELIDAVGRAARLELLVPAGSVTVELSANDRRRWPEWVHTAQSREPFYKVDLVEASSPALAEEMGKLVKKGALYVRCCRSATSECKVLGPAGAATIHCGEFRLWPADGGSADHPRDGPPSKKPKAVDARLEQPPAPDHAGGHRVGEALATGRPATAPPPRDPAMARVAELRDKLAAVRRRAGHGPEAPGEGGGRSAASSGLHFSIDPGGAGAAGPGGPDREERRNDEEGGRLAEELKAKIRELKGPTSVHDRLIERAIERAGRQGRKARDRPLVDTHLTAVLLPASGDRGLRNTRELKTLALAIDHLLSGRICEAGDLLAQRFRAVEASHQEGWAVARHLEVIGDTAVPSLTDREREVAVRQETEDRKFKDLVAKANGEAWLETRPGWRLWRVAGLEAAGGGPGRPPAMKRRSPWFLHLLAQKVDYFLDLDAVVPCEDWAASLKSARVAYDGNAVERAQRLSRPQALPGLPRPENCASIPAEEIAEGVVKEFLENPRRCLLDLDALEAPPTAGAVLIQPGEDLVIAKDVLRFVMNLTASNSAQELAWSWLDLKGRFYLFRSRRTWAPLFAFNWHCEASELGVPGHGRRWLASVTLPTGWKSAMGMVQYLHRKLLMRTGAPSRALPAPRELWKDRAVPPLLPGGGDMSALWQIYADDLDVPTSAEKAGDRLQIARRLGARIDGAAGAVSPDARRIGRIIGAKDLQVLGGHWTHLFQFRREASSLLAHFWPLLATALRRRKVAATELVRTELWLCVVHLPLLAMSLRSAIDPVATASDASEQGGGVCASRGLTPTGRLDVVHDRALLARGATDGPDLASLCDGIGGARQALHLLGVTPAMYCSSEVDDAALRVIRARWPEAVELGGMGTICQATFDPLARKFCNLSLIVVVLGAPSHAPSPLFRFVEVVAAARRAFAYCEVMWLVESVPDMGAQSEEQFSGLLGQRPLYLRPGKKRPPHRLAGCADCDLDTLARWQADGMRHPPCQYKPANCVWQCRQGASAARLRPLVANEREAMMGYPRGYTLAGPGARESGSGPLRNNQLKPGTLKRYGDAVKRFFAWMDRMSHPVPPHTGDFDVLLCEHFEHLWQEGDALALAGDALSGLTHEVKNLKGSLRESWGVLGTWQSLEPPNRAPPLLDEAVCAMAGWALGEGNVGFVFFCYTAYQCILRTGEAFGLK